MEPAGSCVDSRVGGRTRAWGHAGMTTQLAPSGSTVREPVLGSRQSPQAATWHCVSPGAVAAEAGRCGWEGGPGYSLFWWTFWASEVSCSRCRQR